MAGASRALGIWWALVEQGKYGVYGRQSLIFNCVSTNSQCLVGPQVDKTIATFLTIVIIFLGVLKPQEGVGSTSPVSYSSPTPICI